MLPDIPIFNERAGRSLTGKTIWLVGASSGIGYELAKALVGAHNYLYVSARSTDKLNNLAAAHPNNVATLPLDLSDSDSLHAAEKTLVKLTDHIDCLILCAGTCEYDDDTALPEETFERLTRVNYLGAVACVRIALPLLRKSVNKPQIVALSSLASVLPFPRAAAYGASKAALEYFLQSLKIDLQGQGIDTTIIRPGFVDTPLAKINDFPMPFLMSSRRAAREVLIAMERRKLIVHFPGKLAFPMRIMRLFPHFWLTSIAPRFRKSATL